MSVNYGQNTVFGIKNAATWHIPVQLAADCLVKVREVGPVVPQQEILQDETLSGNVYPEQVDYGQENVELTFSGDLRYENNQLMHLSQLVGSDVGTGAAPYTHVIALEDEPDYFYTGAACFGGTHIVEWDTVKPQSFEITSGDDGVMKFNAVGIADHVSLGADATNTAAILGTTATFDTETQRVLIHHCRIRLNNQAAGALSSSDDINARVSIRFSRPLEREFLSVDTGTTDEWKTGNPQQNGFLNDIVLTLDFPEIEDLTYLENFQDGQMKKAEVLFYKSATYSMKFEFPNLQPLQPDVSVGGAGRIPETISFQALRIDAAPTGMSITNPFQLTIKNTFEKEYHDMSAISV